MNREQWKEVDAYITSHVVSPDAALEQALRDSDEAGLPSINVTPNQGKLLMLLAEMIGAKKILEIGTLGGYSTIWLARGLSSGGRLITLEAAAKHAEVAKKNIARAGLTEIVSIRLGQAIETLPKLAAEKAGPFDLIFIDADKASTVQYFDWAVRLARRGSIIIVDNIVRQGKIADRNSQDESVQGIQRFYEMLTNEKRVNATAIQTVGSKGYDGLAIAIVTAG